VRAALDLQGAPLWLHGDLHPANVVLRDGILAGVIDFGEMCAGDPATDLSAAWILLPAGAASRFFDAYGQADDATITRARLGCPARPGPDRDRTEREAWSAGGQTDLGAGWLRHARTGPGGELTA
jgi:aminoglycoside phosphotransferase (APT) family kinase protein